MPSFVLWFLFSSYGRLCNKGPLYFCPVVSSFYLSFFFLSSPNLTRRRLDVYHTFCGPSANLECRSKMCCARLAGNAGPPKSPEFAICVPSHNLSGYVFKARIDNRKKIVKHQYLPQNVRPTRCGCGLLPLKKN